MRHDKRVKRDRHFLTNDGRVACNPRDKEAAHRAEVEGIATEAIEAVTCRKCWNVMRSLGLTRSLDDDQKLGAP